MKSNVKNLSSILVYNIESCGKSLTVINGYVTIEECRYFYFVELSVKAFI